MKIRFEPVVFDTLGSIWGTRAYIDEMERTLPLSESRDRGELKRLADELGFDYEIYSEKQSDADSKWVYWIPRVLSYSLVTLLHSIVETNLLGLCKRLRPDKTSLKVGELKGSPIERSRLYLTKLVHLNIADDPDWETLRDLAKIRNVIVHRGGAVGNDKDQKKQIDELVEKYTPDLKTHIGYLQVSLTLCRKFLDIVEGFFKRLFTMAGLLKTTMIES